MGNPPFLVTTPKMEQHFYELPEKSPISRKRKRKLLFEIEKKKSKKLKSFQKLLQ